MDGFPFLQIDQIKLLLLELPHVTSSTLHTDFHSFVFAKCLCQNLFDTISAISCAIGISELILRRCSSRHWSFIVLDLCLSCLLLALLFYEQRIDRIWLRIQSNLHRHFRAELHLNVIDAPRLLVSYQSAMFIFQILLASFTFITTMLSFSNTSNRPSGETSESRRSS